MSVSTRSLLVPGMALATAGIVALGPTAVAPPAVTMAQPVVAVPTVHIDEIALAGIGRDIYNSISSFVGSVVSSADYWISLVPIIGPPIADQVAINYFGLIRPVIASTVYYLSDLVADPFNFIYWTGAYAANLGFTGYNWVSYQASFFGLPPLPPIPLPPPLASVKAPARGAATTPSAAAAVEAPRPVRGAAAVGVGRPSATVAAPAAASDAADATPAAEGRGSAKAEAPSGKAAASRAGAGSRGGA